MARKVEGGRVSKGRGTKPERKALRRAASKDVAGQGPNTPTRIDKAEKDTARRQTGPRRLGAHTIDAPGHHEAITPGGAQAKPLPTRPKRAGLRPHAPKS